MTRFGFTKREHEVLTLIIEEDLTKREIAARLHIAETTVCDHVKAILRKTNTRSRLGAAVKVLRARHTTRENAA